MSRVPALEAAIVDERKITRYLLSVEHPIGRFKAQFFTSFGSRADSWEVLRDALLQHARENDVAEGVVTQFGTKYVVDGPLPTPDRRGPTIRAIWFVGTDEKGPRFVTAYPI